MPPIMYANPYALLDEGASLDFVAQAMAADLSLQQIRIEIEDADGPTSASAVTMLSRPVNITLNEAA